MRISSEESKDELNRRELEILILLAAGTTSQVIADKLDISREAVKSSLKSVLTKLAGRSRR